MDPMLQRHAARYIYVVPDGLKELMSDISREVVRANPEDICTFIADYLDALLITRENARVAARVVQSLTDMAQNAAIFLEETDIPREDIDQILEAIKQTFKKSIDSIRKFKESEEVQEANIIEEVMQSIEIDPESAEIAAKIIQQAYRRFKERKGQEETLLAGIIDWRVAARSALKLYRKTGVSHEEANRAATLIKAAYKGYYTRKMIKKLAHRPSHDEGDGEEEVVGDDYGECEEESIDEDKNEFDEHKAVKINYDTVIPHVDFNEQRDNFIKKESTTSSIVRYQLNHVLNQAFDTLEKSGFIGPHSESSAHQSDSHTHHTSVHAPSGAAHHFHMHTPSEIVHHTNASTRTFHHNKSQGTSQHSSTNVTTRISPHVSRQPGTGTHHSNIQAGAKSDGIYHHSKIQLPVGSSHHANIQTPPGTPHHSNIQVTAGSSHHANTGTTHHSTIHATTASSHQANIQTLAKVSHHSTIKATSSHQSPAGGSHHSNIHNTAEVSQYGNIEGHTGSSHQAPTKISLRKSAAAKRNTFAIEPIIEEESAITY